MELITEHLLLRRLTAEHFEPFAVMNAEPEVRRYIGDGPLSREDAWWQLARYIGHWELRGYGMWALTDRASDTMVGYAGLLDPEGGLGLEVGWALAPSAWGRGYGYQAARAAVGYAHETLDREQVRAVIHPDNDRSIRLAERLGGRAEGAVNIRGKQYLEYVLRR